MTPPNITKGEWKFSEKTIDGWGGDEVSFSIRDENDEPIVHLDTDRTQARFLAASKAMAEALERVLPSWHKESDEKEGADGHIACEITWGDIRAIKAALLQAGYTE